MALRTIRKSKSRPRPGRRPRGSSRLDRDTIVAAGLALTKSVPLQDVSIVRVAREFDVTPASIHYYLDGRDALTSGIINVFVADLLAHWPELTGMWRRDLEAVAGVIYRHYVRYPGIAAYFAGQNRFSVLMPAAAQQGGERQFQFLDRYFAAVGAAGLDARHTAMYGLTLVRFIHLSAHATASHQWPGEQELWKFHLSRIDPKMFPHISRVRDDYLHLAGDAAFESGLDLILDGLELARRKAKRG